MPRRKKKRRKNAATPEVRVKRKYTRREPTIAEVIEAKPGDLMKMNATSFAAKDVLGYALVVAHKGGLSVFRSVDKGCYKLVVGGIHHAHQQVVADIEGEAK